MLDQTVPVHMASTSPFEDMRAAFKATYDRNYYLFTSAISFCEISSESPNLL